MGKFSNVYEDRARAEAYATLEFPGTYWLAFRDLPQIFRAHVCGKRALDFGCGAGRSTRFLRELGFDTVGVDVAENMLVQARARDPGGDYRLVADGDFSGLGPARFDLVLAAFTFDNIASFAGKLNLFRSLKGLLGGGGRIVNLVSSPEIYTNEWASFSTKDFPENRDARSGDTVLIVMLDVDDRRPVEDIVCSDRTYQRIYGKAGLELLDTRRPLARSGEPFEWVSETSIAPWTIYVLAHAGD